MDKPTKSYTRKRIMKIAIGVGHSRKIKNRIDGGAVSVEGVNEWEYNRELAEKVEQELELLGHQVAIWDSYEGDGYESSMRWLADEIEEWGADAAIELHFNAATPDAHGHEWLYWHSSDLGMLLAASVNAKMIDEIPDLRIRGIKPKRSGDRGSAFLRFTHCPALITEPFFGSNGDDWQIAVSQKADIARVIADGVDQWAGLVED